jgi:hypothetical protein
MSAHNPIQSFVPYIPRCYSMNSILVLPSKSVPPSINAHYISFLRSVHSKSLIISPKDYD